MDKIGKYDIVATMGHGAMGTVYKGFDHRLGRHVAIKTMYPQFIHDEESRTRFFKEARAMGQLSHPNIVNIHDLNEEGDFPFIVMEYLEGVNLKHFQDAKVPLSLPQIVNILIQVALGLDCAHKHGIIHRDVKPANIILLRDGTLKVVDFGIARLVESSPQTITGIAMGTLAYMSPEQARGEKVDPRSDQHSLGVIGYELITGFNPFKTDNATAALFNVLSHVPDPPHAERPDCPKALSKAIMRTLEKDRERRFPDLAAFAEALSAVLQEYPPEDARLDLLVQAQGVESEAAAQGALPLTGQDLPPVTASPTATTVDTSRITARRLARLGTRTGRYRLRRQWPWLAAAAAAILVALALFLPGIGLLNRGPEPAPGPPVPAGTKFVPNAYGGIEIGASGIKALVAVIPPKGNGARTEGESQLRSVNTGVVTFSDAAVEETTREVERLFQELVQKHGVAPEHVYIAASSGVADAARARGPAAEAQLDKLRADVRQQTGRDLAVITPEIEASLGSLGIIPRESWFTAMAFDVGSGNTKGGYVVGDEDDNRFMAVEIPYGTKTFLSVLEGRCGKGAIPPDCLQKALAELLVPRIDDDLERKPGLLSRQEVYLSGGVVWAMATLTHPDQLDRYVTLTAGEIRSFRDRLSAAPDQAIAPDLSSIADPAVRNAAGREIQKVRDAFNVPQLIAGTAILDLLSEKLQFQKKKLVFVRNGLSGWLMGYLKREAARLPEESHAGKQ